MAATAASPAAAQQLPPCGVVLVPWLSRRKFLPRLMLVVRQWLAQCLLKPQQPVLVLFQQMQQFRQQHQMTQVPLAQPLLRGLRMSHSTWLLGVGQLAQQVPGQVQVQQLLLQSPMM